ncbi:unnamed protein product [Vitrella brassicaformis CCMP3155]|uniref:Uncharacterized protein n=1 Tax=Vitrella brassicaformis (strain CCMP3155) TaxID=1169540 RepID=A0A0G4EU42_VITBC|nr:unnamed protein product [Vitrella brassicaformis CCMP3155]|eukprot:CEM01785.1 unnamed protein product [Vitrella brassicaformis CCMP3155]
MKAYPSGIPLERHWTAPHDIHAVCPVMVAYPDVEASAPPATEGTPVPYMPAPSADAADAGERLKTRLKRLENRVSYVVGETCSASILGSIALIAVGVLILCFIWPGITALPTDIEAIKADIAALRADSRGYALKTDIDAIRGDNNNLAASIATLPSNETVQAAIDALRADNQNE